ncbi:protease modulator HflK [Agaricicola taiwanensis]|uniref:Protein HflK n=1 Tax=Agaricicola taiwanensis TaxID=591372 RepID=A0A8J2YHB2_9RHOB|nr:FtsH protease activity modulator HflK [Agaricicola taiwanensis]GGE42575.1 protease modulator HflK [Agaricicola taiwanensis]
MPWSNQSGGGGPWKQNPGPWGSGGGRPGGPGNGSDLEELLRRGQDKLRNVIPGGGGGGGLFLLLIPVVLVLWGLSGLYTVQPSEQGVVLRFGKFHRTTPPGLNYHLPYPIETVLTPNVTENRRIDVGVRITDTNTNRTVGLRPVQEESLMLTGDENIVDVSFSVFWVVGDAADYLFNVQNVEGTINAVAESAMREVIGRSELQPILTGARQTTEVQVHELMQTALDAYGAGVRITQVQLQKVDPPQTVIGAFRDVQAARADQERLQNEAQAYANRVVPEARGEAARITQAAEGYRESVVNQARGQSDRFTQIYAEYAEAPELTRQRMFLETMEKLYGSMDKVIIDPSATGTSGVVPYLPLDQLPRGPQRTPTAQTGATR